MLFLKGFTIRLSVICVVITLLGLGVVSECLSATIKGRIVSDRVDQVENFVVYIKYADSELFTLSKETTVSIQKNNQIAPGVLPIVSNKKVVFFNKDPYFHNLHTVSDSPISFNFGIPAKTKYGPIKFPEEGIVMLLCDIHSEMKGFILVLQNPFFSSVDEKGNFTIPKVPGGEYELITWHEEFISKKKRLIIKDTDKIKVVQFKY